MRVDTTDTNILGSTGTRFEPQFVNNVLSTYIDVGNIEVLQQIRLYRSMAQLKWRITNKDTAPHTVRLRFTVNVRAGALTGVFTQRSGYYFEDPTRGISDDARVLVGADIPNQLNVYGKRYETDDANDPPFAARHILRGFGASDPQKVVLAHPFELRPNLGGFDLPPFQRVKLTDGVATAVYFGPYVIQPNQTQEVTTYYGNGSPTEDPTNDFVVSADGPEALAYNASAVTSDTVTQNISSNPTLASTAFLTPNPFNIYGSVYNQVPAGAQTAVNLNNLRATLTLPKGLALSSGETAEKILGNGGVLSADRGTDTYWSVRPTGEAYGTLAYQVGVSNNELGQRSISRTINIPATPFRTVTAERFQMLGFPFDFDPILSNNGDPSTVVNGLTKPADDPVVFYKYVPSPTNASGLGSYVTITSQNGRLENGVGYMYRPNVTRTIYPKGVKAVAGQARTGITDFQDVKQRQITLEKGWNIISNPYVYDIPLKSLRFVPTENNPDVTSQTFTQAVSSGVIRGSIFFRSASSNSYDFVEDPTSPLKPWEGYWLFVNQRVALIYTPPTQRQSAVLPAPGTDPEPSTRGVIGSGKAFVAHPTANNWRLHLVAQQGSAKTDKATVIGVTSDTTLKASQLSLPKPPPFISDYVYVGVVKKEGGDGRYAKDIRTENGTNSWEVEVTADKAGPVTLTWPNIATLPRRVALTVKDKDSGRVYTMRSTSSLTVNARGNKPTRLVITAKMQSSQPLTIANLRSISNGSRGGGRAFIFNLSREASLTGIVKTVAGRAVATLAAGRAANAGENRLQWNGKAQNGSALPPGPYIIDLVAQGEDGEIAPASRVFVTIE